ncbi:Glycosyltransferase family 28 N-terminal domain-containing protein [Plasmodiophora brassicae]|uniref:Glycosyltransferase family 28 N-terminal domain-containing protein n=1 Tax=Plasmodiophora brassicae TaxID=37360 RepID=A0A0G4IR12_PLABS|nr:hypothetical protein PBRA_000926 [Plasmodiophora brassicae]SPQ97883.1 unnamed protein product [Plasmodiophora brassicae]
MKRQLPERPSPSLGIFTVLFRSCRGVPLEGDSFKALDDDDDLKRYSIPGEGIGRCVTHCPGSTGAERLSTFRFLYNRLTMSATNAGIERERSIASREVVEQLENRRRSALLTLGDNERYDGCTCVIRINRVTQVPGSVSANLVGRQLWVRISVGDRQLYLDQGTLNHQFSTLSFDSSADLSGVEPDDDVDLEMYSWDSWFGWYRVGWTSMPFRELIMRPTRTLLLQTSNGDFLVKKSVNAPTELHISVLQTPQGMPEPVESPSAGRDRNSYAKHVMVLTRGTQGDIQPFVALAMGLAQQLNWMVTICTELRYKPFIKKHAATLTSGAVRFRPSGGDTTNRVNGDIVRWALHTKSAVVQGLILARSEMEFFSSEPIMFWWAEQMAPDALVYGFTVASIAMIISEKLQIPMLGFVLQPTCIPSSQYPPLQMLNHLSIPLLTPLIKDSILSHAFINRLKSYMDYSTLTALRKRRGLPPFGQPWYSVLDQGSPVVVPINEVAFGGRPPDWPSCVELTEFIYLTSSSVGALAPDLVRFLDAADNDGAPVVVIGFSSMPIPRESIARIVIKIAKKCERRPRVVALLGDSIGQTMSARTQATMDALVSSGTVFEAKGAPYSLLFARASCVVIHGGLGATSDAMRAGVPVICTGVLLMDQRFWGNRCSSIGLGPEMTHISDFSAVCVSQIDEVLAVDNNAFRERAAEFAKRLRAANDVDSTGVTQNVRAVARMLEHARPIRTPSPVLEDAG